MLTIALQRKFYYLFYKYGNRPEKLSNLPEALWEAETSLFPAQWWHQRILIKAQVAPLPLPIIPGTTLSSTAPGHVLLDQFFQLLVPPLRGDFHSSLGPMGPPGLTHPWHSLLTLTTWAPNLLPVAPAGQAYAPSIPSACSDSSSGVCIVLPLNLHPQTPITNCKHMTAKTDLFTAVLLIAYLR